MTTPTILGMPHDKFVELVDEDIRGKANQRDAAALREPEVVDRWYQQLVYMKKNVESTLAAKKLEDRENRMTLLQAASETTPETATKLRTSADDMYREYLKWRTGALRFRAGVEERLSEAAWRRRAAGSMVPTALLEERNSALQAVKILKDAIAAHKESMVGFDDADIGQADRDLWDVLNQV